MVRRRVKRSGFRSFDADGLMPACLDFIRQIWNTGTRIPLYMFDV